MLFKIDKLNKIYTYICYYLHIIHMISYIFYRICIQMKRLFTEQVNIYRTCVCASVCMYLCVLVHVCGRII